MIILVIIILVIFLIVFIRRRYWNTFVIRRFFKELSIVIVGKRGTGKDTLMSYISYKKSHNSNVQLQRNTNIIRLEELIIPNLTRQILVNDKFIPIDRDKYSKFDNITFISDSSIYFPSFDDAQLKKEYHELAVIYPIWRHLYKSSLHFNCQNFNRLWKILREQINDTIMCLEARRGFVYTKLKLRYYERPEDAEAGLKPLKRNLFKTPTEKEIELSKRWKIKDYILLIPNRYINHDTYYFHKIVFGTSRKKKGGSK